MKKIQEAFFGMYEGKFWKSLLSLLVINRVLKEFAETGDNKNLTHSQKRDKAAVSLQRNMHYQAKRLAEEVVQNEKEDSDLVLQARCIKFLATKESERKAGESTEILRFLRDTNLRQETRVFLTKINLATAKKRASEEQDLLYIAQIERKLWNKVKYSPSGRFWYYLLIGVNPEKKAESSRTSYFRNRLSGQRA